MKIEFNIAYNSQKSTFLRTKKPSMTNFKSNIPNSTIKNSNLGINRVFEYLFKSNNIVRYVDNNITAGETLANHDENFFKQLFRWGIKTIIDLRDSDKNYQELCNKNGINYVSLPLAHVLQDKKNGIFDYENNGKIRDSFVDEIKTLLSYTNDGDLYLGCQYGVDRTNFALVLDYILNYNSNHRAPKIFPSNYTTRNALRNKNINLVKKIIKKLSLEQRKTLNIPNDFEDTILYKRIGEIVKENHKDLTEKEWLSLGKKINYDFIERYL